MKILISADDGYNSLGVRILARLLKENHEVKIAATKEQRTSAGGSLTIRKNKSARWGRSTVEGIEAVWVDGTPADATDLAQALWGNSFDLIVSGINWGQNVGGDLNSSGTFAAAHRGISIPIGKRAIALSWAVPAELWYIPHEESQSIDQFLEYPGNTAIKVIDLLLTNDFYSADIVNVNFPERHSSELVFTEITPYLDRVYRYPLSIDEQEMTISLASEDYSNNPEDDIKYDYGAIREGYISVTLLKQFAGLGNSKIGETILL